jgi:hypothetical protein
MDEKHLAYLIIQYLEVLLSTLSMLLKVRGDVNSIWKVGGEILAYIG